MLTRSLCFVIFFIVDSYGLVCLHCINARNHSQCEIEGRWEICRGFNSVCKTEIRVVSFRGNFLISKGCKQMHACNNNARVNTCENFDPDSLCYCCCNTDNCNVGKRVCTEKGRNSSKGGLSPDSSRKCPPLSVREGKIRCTSGSDQDSVCRVICNEGYVINTETPSVKCLPTGAWSGVSPRCISIKCWPQLNFVPNGLVLCSNRNRINSKCRFSCRRGFELKGKSSTLCVRNDEKSWSGRWTNEKPACRRKTILLRCGPLPPINNGVISCSSEARSLGSTCRFDCFEGHVLQGRKWVTCARGKSGKPEWTSSQPPTCLPKINNCHVIEGFPRGLMTCDDERRVGSNCSFRCYDNFVLVGPTRITCLGSEEGPIWSDELPSCQAKCRAIERIEHGSIECDDIGLVGATCSFNCEEDYVLIGSYYVTCQLLDGVARWSLETPVCERTCNEIGDIGNGSVECIGLGVSSLNCSFSCSEGFSLVGPRTVTCVEMGDGSVMWDRRSPQCRKVCTLPPSSGNETVFCSKQNFVGSVCQVLCSNSTKVRTVTCIEAEEGRAVWWGDLSSCEDSVCSRLVPVPYGEWNCSKNFTTGTVCGLTCGPSYFVFPPTLSSVTCQKNGEWDASPPCCFAACPPDPMLDVLFVLESVSSRENWIKMIQFIQYFPRFYRNIQNGTRMGVFCFNMVEDNFIPFNYNWLQGSHDVVDRIGNIPFYGQETKRNSSLSLDELFTEEYGDRKEAKDIVIALTEAGVNQSSSDLHTWAERYLTFIVDVGGPHFNANSTAPATYVNVEQYDGLTAELAKQLSGVICTKQTCNERRSE